MRISDWSSDVCSSDLRQIAWLIHVRAFGDGDMIGEKLNRDSINHRRDECVHMRHFNGGETVFAGGAKPLRVRDRSEEHTSELQSLMRISYAVFCLKKKKRKNTSQRMTLQK